jgi:thioredoxin reductase
MFLKSVASASNIGAPYSGLTLGDYCADKGITPFDHDGGEIPIPLDDFVGYGHWIQQRVLPDLEQSEVTGLWPSRGNFELELDSGERVTARTVVVAAGQYPFAYVPGELREVGGGEHSAKGLVSHPGDHADLSALAGQTVAVIGAGQSALESAVLLEESGARVSLVARRPALTWGEVPLGHCPSLTERLHQPPSPLGAGWVHFFLTRYARQFRFLPSTTRLDFVRKILGPSGAWWLRSRFSNEIDVRLGRRLVGASAKGGGVALDLATADGGAEKLVVDHVIAATGYRVNLTALSWLSPDLSGSLSTVFGSPKLTAGFESSVPGLFFSGLAAAVTFGPMLRFVAGSEFAGRSVAAGVSRRIRSR